MDKLRLRRTGLLAVLISLLALSITLPVSADAGPKPSIKFAIEYDIESEPAIEAAVLYECDNPDCRNAVAMEEMGPQGIHCYEDQCDALAYGFADYLRLELTFADGVTRQSDVFTKNRFIAYYTVTVRETDLAIRSTGGLNNPMLTFLAASIAVILFIIAGIVFVIMAIRARDTDITFRAMPISFIVIWILSIIAAINSAVVVITLPLTFVLEASIIIGYAISQKESVPTWFTLVLLANLLTQPLLILGLTLSGGGGSNYWLIMIIAELLVFAAEMGIFHLMKRKDESFGWLQAAIISLILNAASFGVGLILPV